MTTNKGEMGNGKRNIRSAWRGRGKRMGWDGGEGGAVVGGRLGPRSDGPERETMTEAKTEHGKKE